MSGIKKVLKQENGSATAVARKLNEAERGRECTRQLVEYWEEMGYVTPKWAPVVHRVYSVPLHELNPEIYPKSAA